MMKKQEALELAPLRSRYVIESLTQFLSIPERTVGKLQFSSYKKDGQHMCALHVTVPSMDIQEYLDLGITTDHVDIFYEQLFSDLLDTFIEHESIIVGLPYTIRSIDPQMNFTGMNMKNLNGSCIRLDFQLRGRRFQELIDQYTQRIKDAMELEHGKSK